MRIAVSPPVALWHRQLFRLDFEVEGAKAVVIRYHNGNTKPWYMRTRRRYRFKRWFWRKPKDTFRNLANEDQPWIDLWIIHSWTTWPKHTRIRLNVGQIEIGQTDMTPQVPAMHLTQQTAFRMPLPSFPMQTIQISEKWPLQKTGIQLKPVGLDIASITEPDLHAYDSNLAAD